MDEKLDISEKFALLKSIGEEITTEEELQGLLSTTLKPLVYDGFEPSGSCHLAQGLVKALNVNKMIKAGCNVVFWVADWFAQLNNKMGGDLNKIRIVGQYMIEIWKACGMDMENGQVKFLWASEEINKNPEVYWSLVMDICRNTSLSRLRRCTQIMGRNEMSAQVLQHTQKAREAKNVQNWEKMAEHYENALKAQQNDSMPAANILYPAMQCADIYFLGANVCQLGMDQRKVNMLAREYHNVLFRPKRKTPIRYRPKPIIISHHMIMGLKEGQEKMSKSIPDSAIFMEDTAADVNRKIKKAFCRPTEIQNNPIIDYAKYIIFPYLEYENKPFVFKGKYHEFSFDNYADFEKAFVENKVHPSDLKPAIAREINRLLEPVRKYFAENKKAKDLLKRVKQFKKTR